MNSFFSKTYSILANNILLKLIYLLSSFIFVTSLSNITNISILTKISISFAILLIPIGVISSIKDFKNNKLVYILVYSFLMSNLILVFYNYPSIENIKSCIINSILLLVFFSVNTTKNKENLEKDMFIFSTFYIFVTFVLSLISVIIIYLNLKTDIAGLFYNENALGIAAGISILLSIYILLCSKNTLFKIFISLNLFLQSVTLITSGARSSYLLILTPILIAIFINIKSIFLKIFIIFSPLCAFFMLLFSPPNISRIIFTGRENIWKAAFRIVELYPLKGIGNSSLLYNIHSFTSYELNGLEGGRCHNIYVEIAATNGLLLLIIFLALLIAIIIPIYKFIKQNSYNYKIFILFSLILGILLVNLLESSLVYNISFISITFWSISGYLLAFIRNNK